MMNIAGTTQKSPDIKKYNRCTHQLASASFAEAIVVASRAYIIAMTMIRIEPMSFFKRMFMCET